MQNAWIWLTDDTKNNRLTGDFSLSDESLLLAYSVEKPENMERPNSG